jgi:DoxX
MRKATVLIQKLYDGFVNSMSNLQSPLLLVVRLYWGWQISQNGWAKLHNISHVTEFFGSLGLPAPGPTAIFVSSTELVVGILLAVGLLFLGCRQVLQCRPLYVSLRCSAHSYFWTRKAFCGYFGGALRQEAESL